MKAGVQVRIKELLKPSVIKEFMRYAVVGGISFLADFGTLTLFEELIFRQQTDRQIFISTAAGFIVGLVINYILSLIFVFRSKDNKGLMHLGVNVLGFHYMITKIVTAGIVLIWNYLGRKILIFNRSKGEKQ